MKKNIMYILITVLVVLSIVGITYAYFTLSVDNIDIITNSNKFEVIYIGGKKISGRLEFTNSKTEDMKTTVNMKMAEDSVLGVAKLYIQIDEITDNIANESLIWEVYKNYNGEESLAAKGTFANCQTGEITRNCKTGDKLYLINNYRLSTQNTSFTIYIWLDGNIATNSAIGGTFKGHIGAETETFTGNLG